MCRNPVVVAANQAYLFCKEQTVEDRTGVLQRELNELRDQIDILKKNLEEQPDYGLGQGDHAITQRELDRTLLQQLEARAVDIESTLSQTTENMYGVCGQCGEPIHPDRLAVLPNTKVCIQCAKANVS